MPHIESTTTEQPSSLSNHSLAHSTILRSIETVNEPERLAAARAIFVIEDEKRKTGPSALHEGDSERFFAVLAGATLDWDLPANRRMIRHLELLCTSPGDEFVRGPVERTTRNLALPEINYLRAQLLHEELIPHDLKRLMQLIENYKLFSADELNNSRLKMDDSWKLTNHMMKLRHTLLMESFIQQSRASDLPWKPIRDLCRWAIARRIGDVALFDGPSKSFSEHVAFFEAHAPNEQWWKSSVLRLFGIAGGGLGKDDLGVLSALAAQSPTTETESAETDARAEKARTRTSFHISTQGMDRSEPLLEPGVIVGNLRKLGLALPELQNMYAQAVMHDMYVVKYVPLSLEDLLAARNA